MLFSLPEIPFPANSYPSTETCWGIFSDIGQHWCVCAVMIASVYLLGWIWTTWWEGAGTLAHSYLCVNVQRRAWCTGDKSWVFVEGRGKPDLLVQLQPPSPVLMTGVLFFCLKIHSIKFPMGLKCMALTPAQQPVLPNCGSPLSFSPVFSPRQWRRPLNRSPRPGSQCLLPEPVAKSPLKPP